MYTNINKKLNCLAKRTSQTSKHKHPRCMSIEFQFAQFFNQIMQDFFRSQYINLYVWYTSKRYLCTKYSTFINKTMFFNQTVVFIMILLEWRSQYKRLTKMIMHTMRTYYAECSGFPFSFSPIFCLKVMPCAHFGSFAYSHLNYFSQFNSKPIR